LDGGWGALSVQRNYYTPILGLICLKINRKT